MLLLSGENECDLNKRNVASNSYDLLEDVMLEEIDAAANLISPVKKPPVGLANVMKKSVEAKEKVRLPNNTSKNSNSIETDVQAGNSFDLIDLGGDSIEDSGGKQTPDGGEDFEKLISKYETILSIDDQQRKLSSTEVAEDSWGSIDTLGHGGRESPNKRKPID